MRITIVGTGYVGLVSGTCFAEFGVNVVCVDKDHEKIRKLRKGVIPIFEPGLKELVKKNIKEKNFSSETDLSKIDKELICYFFYSSQFLIKKRTIMLI